MEGRKEGRLQGGMRDEVKKEEEWKVMATATAYIKWRERM